MIPILVWFVVAVGTGYEITVHGFWRDGLAACAVLAFVLWLLGGAALISARGRIPPRAPGKITDAERAAMLELSRKQDPTARPDGAL